MHTCLLYRILSTRTSGNSYRVYDHCYDKGKICEKREITDIADKYREYQDNR